MRQLLAGAVAATCAAISTSLSAQTPPTRPGPGQRVRLHLVAPAASVDGTVLGWAADTLLLGPLRRSRALPDTLMRVPRTSIVSFQPGLGPDRDRGFAQGARTGAIVGGTIGLGLLLIGILIDASGENNSAETLPIPAAVITGVFGAGITVAGLLIGAAAGSAGAPERWGDRESVASLERPFRFRWVGLVVSPAP